MKMATLQEGTLPLQQISSGKAKRMQLKRQMRNLQQIRRRGVIYVGHIPHGFYETQMREYFTQFGTVKRVNMARSRKTGTSKGYAFVEFEDKEVAEIVSQTMNNYLFCKKILKCSVVPSERCHSGMFRKVIPVARSLKMWRQRMRQQINSEHRHDTLEKHHKRVKKLIVRERKTKKILEDMGIKYDFPEYSAIAAAKGIKRAKHTTFADDDDDSHSNVAVGTPGE